MSPTPPSAASAAIFFHASPDLRARLDAEVARQRAASAEHVSIASVLRGLLRALPEAPPRAPAPEAAPEGV